MRSILCHNFRSNIRLTDIGICMVEKFIRRVIAIVHQYRCGPAST